MFYDKKIRYLDYCKNGERIRNGGFARTEVQGDSFRLEISLKGLYGMNPDSAKVFLQSSRKEVLLGQLAIKNGCGEFRYGCMMRDGIGEAGLKYGEITGIRIPLDETAEVSGRWNTDFAEGQKEVKEIAVAEKGHSEQSKKTEPEKLSSEFEESSKKEIQPEDEQEKASEPEPHSETISILEDKWLQLVSIYPHIKPFRDARDYLSVSPADFVLFTGESYRAANNSFLLHGYYNYRHLILTRVERRGEILYYVGVPGNYYTKEKQVAVMFGFESFECAEEPAQDGDFGYYMMRVRL